MRLLLRPWARPRIIRTGRGRSSPSPSSSPPPAPPGSAVCVRVALVLVTCYCARARVPSSSLPPPRLSCMRCARCGAVYLRRIFAGCERRTSFRFLRICIPAYLRGVRVRACRTSEGEGDAVPSFSSLKSDKDDGGDVWALPAGIRAVTPSPCARRDARRGQFADTRDYSELYI
ncbi:hypothetical protein B0H11DRAFT_2274779 [Mycena galericulata]|nr:hypothetical protein B0H11DRAFT_2274779 [Mycena galericulata]